MRRTGIPVGEIAALLLLGGVRQASSQTPHPDNYEHFLPDPPAIVAQSEASVRFHLFGNAADPAYVDVAPKDGVDDRRAARLLQIAEHFSPILRRNTYSVPEAFEATVGDRVVMHVDSWLDGRKIASDVVDLGPPLPPPSYTGTEVGPTQVAPDDGKLRALLLARDPD